MQQKYNFFCKKVGGGIFTLSSATEIAVFQVFCQRRHGFDTFLSENMISYDGLFADELTC